MKRRFVILADDATPAQQNVITLYLKDKFAYWHRFSDSWLITTSREDWTATKIRDELKTLATGLNVLVLRVDAPKGWAAFGAKGMFEWLHSTWSTE
jgi:hypothetical protein